jgi:hypothetical protein
VKIFEAFQILTELFLNRIYGLIWLVFAAWHAACIGAERNIYIIFMRRLDGRKKRAHLDALDIGEKIIL